MARNPVLEVTDLTVSYEGVLAVDELSFSVAAGEVFVILGANGAGKTSTLRAVSRLIGCGGGALTLDGRDLRRLAAHEAARHGLRHVPEGRRAFPQLSVRENLELGGVGRSRAEIAERISWVYELFPRLYERAWQPAGLMSGGEQQMLAIGRALMHTPSVLLLDEPSLGLSPEMVHRIYESLGVLKKDGVAMVLVEQNAEVALRFADRGCVLALGRMMYSSDAAELRARADLIEAYLGAAPAESDPAEPDSNEPTSGLAQVPAALPYRRLWRTPAIAARTGR